MTTATKLSRYTSEYHMIDHSNNAPVVKFVDSTGKFKVGDTVFISKVKQ